jgi:hypothetical protein
MTRALHPKEFISDEQFEAVSQYVDLSIVLGLVRN